MRTTLEAWKNSSEPGDHTSISSKMCAMNFFAIECDGMDDAIGPVYMSATARRRPSHASVFYHPLERFL